MRSAEVAGCFERAAKCSVEAAVLPRNEAVEVEMVWLAVLLWVEVEVPRNEAVEVETA